MPNLRGVGRDAEDRAAEYLIGKGYTIVTRRYKARRGELDIVALDGDVLVFVEVKYTSAPGFTPEEALGRAKMEALARAIREYIHAMDLLGREVRIDLVAIDSNGIRHYEDLLRP